MDSRWTHGHTGKDKEARIKELQSFKPAFEELSKLLEKLEDPVPDYKNSAWAYAQADVNGANRKLKQIINLLRVD